MQNLYSTQDIAEKPLLYQKLLREASRTASYLEALNMLYQQATSKQSKKVLTKLDVNLPQIMACYNWVANCAVQDVEAAHLCIFYCIAGASILEIRLSVNDRFRWVTQALTWVEKLGYVQTKPEIVVKLLLNLGQIKSNC
jgi:hypothetical protein